MCWGTGDADRFVCLTSAGAGGPRTGAGGRRGEVLVGGGGFGQIGFWRNFLDELALHWFGRQGSFENNVGTLQRLGGRRTLRGKRGLL